MVLPTFDHTIQVILALTPLLVALIGAAVAIAQIVAAREKKAKAIAAGEKEQTTPAVGITTSAPTAVDDDHADDAIGALTDARDLWKGRAEEYRDRLATANTTLRQNGLPTA